MYSPNVSYWSAGHCAIVLPYTIVNQWCLLILTASLYFDNWRQGCISECISGHEVGGDQRIVVVIHSSWFCPSLNSTYEVPPFVRCGYLWITFKCLVRRLAGMLHIYSQCFNILHGKITIGNCYTEMNEEPLKGATTFAEYLLENRSVKQ